MQMIRMVKTVQFGELIGVGNTADVFDIGNHKAAKLFHLGYPESAMLTELHNSQLMNHLDIPIAKSYEAFVYEGRNGIIYDKIEGQSLLEVLFETYDIEKYTKVLANIHKRIVSAHLPDAIDCKAILEKNIKNAKDLNIECQSKLLEILADLPDGDNLCHGDFHFGNLLVGKQGTYIIDFMNVCKGNKNYDIARTLCLIEMTPVPENTPNQQEIVKMKKQSADIYLREMGVSRDFLTDWLTVTVAARLSELSHDQSTEKNNILEYLSLQGL